MKTYSLDREMFDELMHILLIVGSPSKLSSSRTDNLARTAKLLGITRYRMKKLVEEGPPSNEWWWNTVLLETITRYKPQLKKRKKAVVNQALHKLPDETFDRTEPLDIARSFVIQQLRHGKAHGQAVIQEGRTAGIPEHRIRQAAQELGVKMVIRGKGEGHYSTWQLPDWEERL